MTVYPDEVALAQRAIQGDLNAFAVLVERRESLGRFLFRRCYFTNTQDIEDLLSEVRLGMIESIHNLRNPERFTNFYLGHVRNAIKTARTHADREQPAGAGEDLPEPAVAKISEPEREVLENELRRVVLSHVTPRQEQVLQRKLEGMTLAEIADELQCTENTVKGHMHKARKSLETQFGWNLRNWLDARD